MSEGLFFYSAIPNITLRIGSLAITFKNGRYPARRDAFVTDPAIIEAIKTHDSYGKTVESNEDREKRLTPDPKVEKDLVEKAIAKLASIPGVVPSELTPSPPPSDPQEKSPEPESVPSAQAPSLTEVSRMKKDDLFEVAEKLGIKVTEDDTVAILKRRVKSWVKQNTA
jgi:hypothetical protein